MLLLILGVGCLWGTATQLGSPDLSSGLGHVPVLLGKLVYVVFVWASFGVVAFLF